MTVARVRLVLVLSFAVLLFPSSGYGRDAAGGLAFPPSTPPWLAAAVTETAARFGDSEATIVTLELGRFPTVVIKGEFRSPFPVGPLGSYIPTGQYLAWRFDALTRRSIAFGISPIAGGALCPAGPPCESREEIAIRSALASLRAGDQFGPQTGRRQCMIREHPPSHRIFRGECSLAISLGEQRSVLTFTQTWTSLDRFGRRYSPLSPVHRHVWRVIVTPTGWVTSVHSSGDIPPQLKRQ